MRWYDKIKAAHLAVTDAVSHYARLKSERYFVWQEDGDNQLRAGNALCERAVTGSTDLYTKIEYDPWIDELQKAFDDHGISWHLNSVQYEEDTGFIHTEWVWEVDDDGEAIV